MIRKLVDGALDNKLLVIGLGIVLAVWGGFSFKALPIEAYPDVADTWVQVITQWPGHAAEEVEQQVTIPIEVQMNGVSHLTHMRSLSLFGLSVVTMIFDDDANNLMCRAQVLEKLSQVSLAPGISPQIGPDYSPVGQIYWFTLKSTNPQVDLMEQKTLMDWYIHKYLKSVPNVVDVSTFGGITQEYQVLIDPQKLVSYGVGLAQVEQALMANNINTGGSFIERGGQSVNIRAVGLYTNVADIKATVIKSQGGTSVKIKDIAEVTQGAKIRLGRIGKAIHREDNQPVEDHPDVVEGIVLLRKGAEPEKMLEGLHAMVDRLNNELLPPGVKIVPHLDRGDLVHLTSHTVEHNLFEGMSLVALILFLFLGNLRSALIVTLTIPFALLFASILLDLRHIPANLLSLGALDFGMVVDGSVVMIENILRHVGRTTEQRLTLKQQIAMAVHEVTNPVFFSIFIIITAYLPIFTLQRVEGRLFSPMAWTVAFALMGALIFALFIAPILASLLFTKGMKEWHNPVLKLLTWGYRQILTFTMTYKWLTTIVLGTLLLGTTLHLAFSGVIGSEFLPHLDEGAIWVRGTLAPSTGPSESLRVVNIARLVFAKYDEVTQVVSQNGRPDDGTDPSGFSNTEFYVDLKPHEAWRKQFKDKEALIEAMSKSIEEAVPGATWNFSQPIADNMEEAVSGVKGAMAVKIFGNDLQKLEELGDKTVATLREVKGVADLGMFRVHGQPNLNVVVDRYKADQFGINVADIQDAIEAAVGGKAVTQVLQDERRFDLVVRYPEKYRKTRQDIEQVRLQGPTGERIALSQVCKFEEKDGASTIYRESNSRYLAMKYSVRGRDLGSTVEESIAKVTKAVPMPKGYYMTWEGEYESKKRAEGRLLLVVPVTILIIVVILYGAFNSMKYAMLNMTNVAMGRAGGLLALYLTGTNFSVSSGVGFLALFGVSIQTGVIMVEYIHQLRSMGLSINDAAREGAISRLRPIMMTMMVATLGLLPAATSHGIGSDSQRPFAIVIVGGLVCDLICSLVLLPTLYTLIASDSDHLPEVSKDAELPESMTGHGHAHAEVFAESADSAAGGTPPTPPE